jgi:hypothetical protein
MEPMKTKSFSRFILLIGILAASLGCKAGAIIPNLFATATPTPTATFTPSPTPPPTATPTLTPTPLPSGVVTQSQADGATLVRDYDNHYELTLPKNWVVIPLTREDLTRLVEQAAAQNPEFADTLEAFKKLDPETFRLIGLNSDQKYEGGQYPTIMSITAISDPVAASMPMSFVTALVEDNVLKGSKDSTWEVVTNTNGLEIGVVEGSLAVQIPQGGTAKTRTKMIVFQANKKLIMIQIITPTEFGAEVLPAADQIIDTIRLMEP